MPRPALPTTRRAALGGVLALVAASACDVDDLRPPEDDQPTPAASPEPPAPGSDEALVESVAMAIASSAKLVNLVRRRFPQLGPTVRPLAGMHRAHLRVLAVEPRTQTSTSPPASPGRALSQLRSRELRLQQELADAAVGAQSGALARLLASMSAAVAQHLAVLPSDVPAGAGR